MQLFRIVLAVVLGIAGCSCYSHRFESAIGRHVDSHFLKLATEHGTDKVGHHNYDFIYSRYLHGVRHLALNMLELGLGCTMHYGAGASFKVWKDYLPKTNISFLEADYECGEKYRAEIEKASGGRLYLGQQSDDKLLRSILSDTEKFGRFDLIVDDATHIASDMYASFKILWKALKPGGIYVVEDYCMQYMRTMGDGDTGFSTFTATMVERVNCFGSPEYKDFRPDVQQKCESEDMQEFKVYSFECMSEACVFVKASD